MIRPQLILDVHDEIFVDNFAGGGGASTGYELATGRHVDHAINHDRMALGMHRINHPQTIHHCEDVFDVDPAQIAGRRRVGGAWFSPDCKHFSKAKGGKPLDKKIRGLALVILRWAAIRTRVIYMENVEEIATWGPLLPNGKPDPEHKGRTWRAFLSALSTGLNADHPDIAEILAVLGQGPRPITKEQLVSGFGYAFETQVRRAANAGAPTIRKRLYMIARCDGLPIVWPEPTHAQKPTGKLKPWRMVAECIDWSLHCPSIFLTGEQARVARCKRPLVRSTLRRVAAGIDRHVLKAKEPFIVSLTHQGGDRIESINEPAMTITGAHRGEKAIVVPSIVGAGGPTYSGKPRNVTGPAHTLTAENHSALVQAQLAPFLSEHVNATSPRSFPADEPMRTQCAQVKGGHFTLIGATIAGVGGRMGQSPERPVNKPMQTITAKADSVLAAASLVKLRGDDRTHGPTSEFTAPLDTISAGGTHHALSAVYLAQHNGGFNTTRGHPATEPISTIGATGSQQQVVSACLAAYYGNDKEGQGIDEPLRTVTTKERFGFVETQAAAQGLTVEQLAGAHRVAKFLREHGVEFEGEFATVGGFVIVDIGMRMLTPRELFRAQGFSNRYVIDRAWIVDPHTGEIVEVRLTKEQQIRMCGNSVCPPEACALIGANNSEMAIWNQRERQRAHHSLNTGVTV